MIGYCSDMSKQVSFVFACLHTIVNLQLFLNFINHLSTVYNGITTFGKHSYWNKPKVRIKNLTTVCQNVIPCLIAFCSRR